MATDRQDNSAFRAQISAVRIAMTEALEQVKADKDLSSLVVGKCVYDADSRSFRFTVECVAKGGVDREGARYKQVSKALGLPDLGAHFFARPHQKDVIVGINTTCTKVITLREGKKYLWPVEAVKKFMVFAEAAS